MLAKKQVRPLNLQPKVTSLIRECAVPLICACACACVCVQEGLSLISGTQLVTALAAEALVRAHLIALSADAVAALTLEALKVCHGRMCACMRMHPLTGDWPTGVEGRVP